MSITRLLLLPFAALYKAATDVRNVLYEKKVKKSYSFDRTVISVGNLTAGGTGKTPFVEMLIRILRDRHNLSVLSRGYGRKTSGFRIAGQTDNASTLGDEPFQYFLKFGDTVTVAVGEKRADAIKKLIDEKPHTDIFILDDAYQHRSVLPDINILLTDFHRPFYKDYVLPAGMLREARKNAARADFIVVTKCPADLSSEQREQIKQNIMRYAGMEKEVFFSGIRYLEPVRFHGKDAFSEHIFLFTGIANPAPMADYIDTKYHLLEHKKFPDHYDYSAGAAEGIMKNFSNHDIREKCLLTTEKDMVRIRNNEKLMEVFGDVPLFYLPIELYFLEKGDFFAKYLKDRIKKDESKTDKITRW